MLEACGVPVPQGRSVQSADDAWEAAEEIGVPVVVKPCDGNHGRGVFTNLRTRAEIATAYDIAADEGSGVIVERFISGNEHRLLVVGGKLVAAARGMDASVIGDGKSTVTELIRSQLNSDPRRGRTEDHPLNPVRLDSAARIEIARQGHAAESIPAEGLSVLIQRNGNVAFEVTELVHPSVAAHVELAARIVGLDIAGVDLVADDISRPLEEQGGAIVEVNAGPGLLMHLKPAEGQPQPVGKAIVEHLFPGEENGRIPIVGVTGTWGKTTVARLVSRLLHLSGKHVGLACSTGLYFNRRQVDAGKCADWKSGRRALSNRAVDAAVFENGSRMILTEGLVYDRCQVGIVLNVDTSQTLPDLSITEPEQLATVFRTQVDVILPTGCAVLNAADPLVVEMADLCDGDVILFAADPALETITTHLAQGNRAVCVRAGQIVLANGSHETALTALSSVPATRDGADAAQVANVLAAVAAAWALDISPDCIRAGIETFELFDADVQPLAACSL